MKTVFHLTRINTLVAILVVLMATPASAFSPQGFSEVPSGLKLDPTEHDATVLVVDPANGFAYFGTDEMPTAMIVKVRLSDFTRVGSLLLNPGEGNLKSAVIDPAHGLANFGTGENATESGIIKVDVNPAHSFARLDAIEASTPYGSSGYNAAVIDLPNHLAYFVGAGMVARVDVNPAHIFAILSTANTQPGETPLTTGVIDPANGFAYFATHTNPSIVVKVDVNPAHPFTRVASLALNKDKELNSTCAIIDPAKGFAYFCAGTNFPGIWGSLVKIDLATFNRVGSAQMSGVITPNSAVIDPAAGYAYVGTGDSFPGEIIRVQLSTLNETGSLTLNANEDQLYAATIDPGAGYAYFATNWGAFSVDNPPGKVIKVRLADLSRVGTVTFYPGDQGISTAVIDPAAGFAYYGTNGNPGRIVKVRLADFTKVGALTLNPGERFLNSAAIDPTGGYAYFGTNTDPGMIVKIRLSDFTRVGVLTLNTGERYLASAVIDPAGGFAYFTTDTSTPMIVKVHLTDFTRVGALSLISATAPLIPVIDPPHGFAYFETFDYPKAQVVKVSLSTFTEVNRTSLNDPGGVTAAIDPDAGYGYFATSDQQIYQIKLEDLSYTDQVGLISADGRINSMVIDPAGGSIYIGAHDTPGFVVKVGLTPFRRVGRISLDGSENGAGSALADPSAGFAYFVTNNSGPPVIARVDISNTAFSPVTVALASSANPTGVGQAVNFTATVKSAMGSGTPTGSVQFEDGGVNLGTPVNLAGGSASLNVSSLAAGNHAVTVAYSGDSVFNSRASSVLIQVITHQWYILLPSILR